jgi:probable F420-dependent oxidoreductase
MTSGTRAPSLTLSLLNFAPAGAADPTELAAAVLRRAQLADQVGVDRVTVVDHVVMGDRIDAYDGGRFPTGPDGIWLEPLTLLAAIAATTRRVRLATAILVAPLRRAPALAKAVATLDVVSGGRVEIGVGVGWQREEYDASGVPFAGRGGELDRVLGELQRLWRGEAVLPATAADGSTQTAGAQVWCEPRPVQPGGVPLWISGRLHDRTLDRMVRFGDGWIPWGEHRRDVVSGIPRVHAALEAASRDPAGFGVRGTLPVVMDGDGRVDGGRTAAPVPAMVEAGVTDFGLFGAFSPDDDAAGEQLSTVVSAFAEATGRVAVGS